MQQKRKTAERTRNQQLNDGNVGSQYNIELCINEQNLRAIMCVFLLLNSCSVVAVVQLGDRNSFSSHTHAHKCLLYVLEKKLNNQRYFWTIQQTNAIVGNMR